MVWLKDDGRTLVMIGGNEDKTGKRVILEKVVELAGEDRAHLVVLTTASHLQEKTGWEYHNIFKQLGVKEVRVLCVRSRKEADNFSVAEEIAKASGVFFTGGDQLRITGTLGGTAVHRMLHRVYGEGTVIAGTSAGAAAISGTMIVGGDSDAPPKKEIFSMAPGMGLLEDVVIDQHFAQRGRLGRLLAVVAHNPYILGIGIDEDTAVVVRLGHELEVIGSQSVTIIDGHPISFSNVSEQDPHGPLTLFNVRLHVLAQGYKFDLKSREPVIE